MEFPKSLLISGESGMGKSVSLMNLKNPEGVLYFNCEYGKPLPFKNKFVKKTITDPEDIIALLQMIREDEDYHEMVRKGERPQIHTVIIDTVSFMMDMYETEYIIGSSNTQAAWGNYAQFFRRLMSEIAKTDVYAIFLGHLESVLDEDAGIMRTRVPVKGALAKKGLEAFFTTVINVSKVPIRELEKTPNALLTTSPREEALGFKHVFQTQTTKKTVGDRIRSPFGLFKDEELYINNDAQVVIDRLHEYYTE